MLEPVFLSFPPVLRGSIGRLQQPQVGAKRGFLGRFLLDPLSCYLSSVKMPYLDPDIPAVTHSIYSQTRVNKCSFQNLSASWLRHGVVTGFVIQICHLKLSVSSLFNLTLHLKPSQCGCVFFQESDPPNGGCPVGFQTARRQARRQTNAKLWEIAEGLLGLLHHRKHGGGAWPSNQAQKKSGGLGSMAMGQNPG